MLLLCYQGKQYYTVISCQPRVTFFESLDDATTQEILEILFSAFSSLISRLVEDHLLDGKYHNLSAKLIAETKSVPTTNVISERDFAKLDRFLREIPNASTLSLEAMIMFTNNKTASWLNTKTLKERRIYEESLLYDSRIQTALQK